MLEADTSLATLSRRELQALAKEHGIKANLKSSEIIDALRELRSVANKEEEEVEVVAAPPAIEQPPEEEEVEEEAAQLEPPCVVVAPIPRRTWEIPLAGAPALLLPSVLEPESDEEEEEPPPPAAQPPSLMMTTTTTTQLAGEALTASAASAAANTTHFSSWAASSSFFATAPPAASNEDDGKDGFFGHMHQRVSVLLASPVAKHASLRKSLTSLSNTLLDAVVVARSATPKEQQQQRPPAFYQEAAAALPPPPPPPIFADDEHQPPPLPAAPAARPTPSKAAAPPSSSSFASPAPSLLGSRTNGGDNSLLSTGARRAKIKPPVPRFSVGKSIIRKQVGPPLPKVSASFVGFKPSEADKRQREARRGAYASKNKAERQRVVHAARWR